MLVNVREMLLDAKKKHYAVVAADAWSLDSAKVLVETAIEHETPLILMTWQGLPPGMINPEYIALLVKEIAGKSPVPIALHLDHSTSYEDIARHIHAGYTSVMIDASTKSFDENVAITREVVRMAHACNVSVEAELGHVGSGSDESDKGILTSPQEAVDFVAQTGVDCLAVSVGTAHGIYSGGVPHLDYDRLLEIRDAVDVPLVLHGGSGTGLPALKKAAACGICKLNVFTDFLTAAYDAFGHAPKFQEPVVYDVIKNKLLEYMNAVSVPQL